MFAMKTLFLSLVVVATLLSASDRITEESAVAQLKKTSAYQLDPSLPNRTFGSWVAEKFPDWNIQWKLQACGEVKIKNNKGEAVEEGPICVQVNIMQPGQKLVRGEPADGFHLLFLVGTGRHGLMPASKLLAARRTEGEQVERLHGLSEVEP
jgi:hypothetical protein